ncbi:claw keratin-like [Neopelma chrysocephalum]|uniref:claw keratin-like n=1 Tax=Neopelma chrysocephalum TaxID=114329 RepID=UPI000FCD3FA2|nr:claw keratin-like [Neopelma chrysocephalum]
MVLSRSPCTEGSPSPCGVAVPQPVAESCNEPCVRQCPDSTVVIYPPPVVVTFPGPILSTFPQQSVVGSAGAPEVGAGAGFGAARTPGASHVYGGARWARGYPVGSCRPC